MARRLISSGSTFEARIGYSRAVVDGDWVFVSGTTGFDYAKMSISGDPVEQCEQCLKPCWPTLQRWFGKSRPAAMMISAGLLDPRMKIEIEVTARISAASARRSP
jgi:enamine deaminase RidA (YjgF/YER057c/UK114 family)